MIFQHTHEQVMSGQKTRTMRLVNKGDVQVCGQIIANFGTDQARIRFMENKTYSVQPGRGQKSIGSIRVTEINSVSPNQLTISEIFEEGFQTRAEFYRAWKKMHGQDSLNLACWVLHFDLVRP